MLNKLVCIFVMSVILLTSALPLHAEITLGDYNKKNQASENHRQVLSSYIAGIGAALLWANAALASKKQPLLYCQPDIGLSIQNYENILDREIKRVEYRPEAPLPYLLLQALEHVFPCDKK
jgi:hypothetical protein